MVMGFETSQVLNQVHHIICLDVNQIFSSLAFKRKKPILFFVSILQFLRAFFRQNLCSSFVKFVVQLTHGHGNELPQSKEDAYLYPLAKQHVLSLVICLQNLLVQKDFLLSQTVIGCLEVLLEYLYLKNQSIACHIASQPWNKFLLITLLDGGENSFLHPEILRLFALFIRYESIGVISQSEISHILEEAANTKLPELSDVTVSALRSFLLQVISQYTSQRKLSEASKWKMSGEFNPSSICSNLAGEPPINKQESVDPSRHGVSFGRVRLELLE
ncbi:meiosis inhibitor protein 1-like [Rhineura floridana]|uniref:meiosis inhibitor protein 1-like n=1 Tax=Rhineura floridana TaxID=261503 RepID=UPI002AC876A6|nr:meiosis inhibitor protein 1-like [Rhineura floridana]